MSETAAPADHPCVFCPKRTRYYDPIRKAHICIDCLARLTAQPCVSFPTYNPLPVPQYPYPPAWPQIWCFTPTSTNSNGVAAT